MRRQEDERQDVPVDLEAVVGAHNGSIAVFTRRRHSLKTRRMAAIPWGLCGLSQVFHCLREPLA